MENRRSQLIPQQEDAKSLRHVPSPVEQETPKPEMTKEEQAVQEQAVQEQKVVIATPRPQVLRRKTSKFIEHLDASAEKLNLPLSPPPVVITEPKQTLERSRTVPILGAPQVRRSISMRTPSPNPASWGAVVCTAQARPIVAAGHARMIQS
jgi:hypothetical protein